jgi:hypothetical protein
MRIKTGTKIDIIIIISFDIFVSFSYQKTLGKSSCNLLITGQLDSTHLISSG